MKRSTYSIEVLENGMRLVTIPMEGTRTCAIDVVVPVGSRYESAQDAGMSHFIEHMMFKGTSKRVGPKAIARSFERLGASYNASTGKELTSYYMKLDGRRGPDAVELLADMIFGSTMPDEELAKEKGVIIEELKMYQDNPIMHIGEVADELMYQGALGRDIGGSIESVSAVTREQMMAFRAAHYQPNQMIVAIAGNISDETRDAVRTHFGSVQSNESADAMTCEVGMFGELTDRIRVDVRDIQQAQLVLMYPGITAADHAYAPTMSLMKYMIGGSMLSRLFLKIREELGLVYSIHMGSMSYRDIGDISISMGLDPERMNDAIQAVHDELMRFAYDGPTTEELEDAKMGFGGKVALALDNPAMHAGWMATELLYSSESIMTPEERLARIEQVSKEDVQALAKRLFVPDALRIAAIAPKDAIELPTM
jgi:predicted Zn-dependent peptidase